MGCSEFFTAYILPKLKGAAGAAVSFLSSQAVERTRHLIDLGKNADKLAVEMRRLSEIRDDLLRQVEIEELRPRMKRSRRVAGWIDRVDQLEETVGAFRDSFDRRRTFAQTCSPSSLVYSNFELAQTAVDRLGQVSELKNERDSLQGGDLVFEEPPEAVVPVASSATTRIVGAERVLAPLRGYLLSDDAVGVVGIYGMGGTGKTTYMTMVNKEFLQEAQGDFDVVIWVTVSQTVEISRLQEEIGVRLGFSRTGNPGALPVNSIDRRDALYRALSRKRFLLLLDDVWEELKLHEIGIPRPPENRSKAKVVFTTRAEEVCVKMGAHKSIKAGILDTEQSWELFNLKLGSVPDLSSGGRSSSSLLPLAKTVVERCGGLPLALITVARAMSGAETVDEWEDAAAKLRESPEQVKGMEEEVLSILKFSFDKLKDDSMRDCLLYCCLFPEDDEINTEELIEYYVGEGFLDTTKAVSGSRSSPAQGARRRQRPQSRVLAGECRDELGRIS